jgi:hypothetical protein
MGDRTTSHSYAKQHRAVSKGTNKGIMNVGQESQSSLLRNEGIEYKN